MLAQLKKAKQDYVRMKQSRDDIPPMLDPQSTQFGASISGVTFEDLEHRMPNIEAQALRDVDVPRPSGQFRGSAAGMRERNTTRYKLTDADSTAPNTPASTAGSPPQKPARLLGAAETLMKKALP